MGAADDTEKLTDVCTRSLGCGCEQRLQQEEDGETEKRKKEGGERGVRNITFMRGQTLFDIRPLISVS